MNMCHHELGNACQKQARAEKRQVTKTVPRRPNQLLKGTLSQQLSAQHMYGAELTRPVSHVDRESAP